MPSPESAAIEEQFVSAEHQHETAISGMWLFLSTEVLFFGGLFAAYSVDRLLYPRAFAHHSRELSLTIGTVNTAVLLTSSLTMALAVHFSKQEKRRLTSLLLFATALFAALFLFLKGLEWSEEIPKAGSALFFGVYFSMTGFHGLHVLIGLVLLVLYGVRVRSKLSLQNSIEVLGLYWHFVDLIWIFLFPLLYLVDRA